MAIVASPGFWPVACGLAVLFSFAFAFALSFAFVDSIDPFLRTTLGTIGTTPGLCTPLASIAMLLCFPLLLDLAGQCPLGLLLLCGVTLPAYAVVRTL